MNMNFVFLSPHFPVNFYLFCVRLRERGVNVLGIADQEPDQLRPELRAALGDYVRVRPLDDYDQMLKACGYFISRHGRIHGVESHNEHWLTYEAQLREDFNIPGVKPHETDRIKKKSAMKEIFAATGALVARGEIFTSLESAEKFAKKVGYPIFAKPNIGVGGCGTYKIHNPEELNTFAETKPQEEYLIEEFIDGNLATYDGLTDLNGDVPYFTSHFSDTGVFEIVHHNEDLNYYSLREIPEDIKEMGLKAVKAFGVKAKFFHIEFLRRKSDRRLVAMEVNMRPPGGFTTDMMNFADDLDVYQEWVNVITGLPFQGKIERKYHCAHVARKEGKTYRLSHEEIINRFQDRIVMFSEVSQIFSAVMGNRAYLVRSQNLQEVKEMISEIQAKV